MSDLHRSRNRIAGRKIDPSKYDQAIKSAIRDQIKAGNFSPSSIGNVLGKDRSTITRYVKEMEQEETWGIKRTETGRIEKVAALVEQAKYEALSLDSFVVRYPAVQKWDADMKKREIKTRGKMLNLLKTICDIMKLPATAFTVSQEANETLLLNLKQEVKKINPGLRDSGWQRYTKVIRNFAASAGVGWQRGMAPAIATGKKFNYGEYSRLYVTDAQRQTILHYAADNFERNIAVAIALGHEVVCPRDETLRELKVSQIHFRQRFGFEVAEFEVKEAKTETIWPKQAFDPGIVKMLKQHIAYKSPDSFVLGNERPINQEDLARSLRECYRAAGIDVVSDGDPKLINYYKKKSIHMMRHSTATMWMRRSGLNPLPVAKQAWKTTDMVTQVYANMGLEEYWNQNRCDNCKPDPNASGDAIYCSWKCALIHLNKLYEGAA